MSNNDILGLLQPIFRQVFNEQLLQISLEFDSSMIEGWDSIMHINLIVAIEERFNIIFTTEEIGNLICVGSIVDLIERKTS